MNKDPIHPDNKITYKNGDKIEFTIDGNVDKLYTGKIKGIATLNVIDFWIIEYDVPNDLNWDYDCITLANTFIRKQGSNEPFLCEGRNRYERI